jgi:hypothetical protein
MAFIGGTLPGSRGSVNTPEPDGSAVLRADRLDAVELRVLCCITAAFPDRIALYAAAAADSGRPHADQSVLRDIHPWRRSRGTCGDAMDRCCSFSRTAAFALQFASRL